MVKAGMLGITSIEVVSCSTLQALKSLARQKFIALARLSHPDHLHRQNRGRGASVRKARGKEGESLVVTGRQFRSQQACYEWFRNLDERTYSFALKARVTAYDMELPLDWSGWHNYDSFYAGFRVSYWV